ncbi:MAG: transcription factor S [Nanoarchaeota archaeon]
MVEFCKNCDAIIIGKKGEEVKCSACGEVQKTQSSLSLNIKVEPKKQEKEVLDKNTSEGEIHPVIQAECPKCHFKEAYYWTKQTRAGDEPETMFFKCVKCKHQWREYR